MRLFVTADIHYGARESGDRSARRLAERVEQSQPDALLVAGDTAPVENESHFRAGLALFERFPGIKLLVAGNHDLWTFGGDSETIYRERLPHLAAEHGFHPLDAKPLVVDGVGFVGTVGWYDYSFRRADLAVEPEHYRAKRLPRSAQWMDGTFIRWRFSDEAFTDLVVRKLEADLRQLECQCERIVCLMHHIPFRELVHVKNHLAWDFCNAFMGAERLGQTLLGCKKVQWAFCGHSHRPGRVEREQVTCINVGSTYGLKRYAEVDLTDPSNPITCGEC